MAEQIKDPSFEFAFVRDKLEKIALILMQHKDGHDLLEVAFMLGRLQNICHENWVFFKKDDE